MENVTKNHHSENDNFVDIFALNMDRQTAGRKAILLGHHHA